MPTMTESSMQGHNTFWVDSQVVFTFTVATTYEGDIFDAINLNGLSSFLKESGFLLIKFEDLENQGLQSADELPADQQMEDMQSGEKGRQTHPGVYIFRGCESGEMLVVAFFQFHDIASQHPSGSSGEHGDDAAIPAVARLVNLVNSNLETLHDRKVPITSGATTGCSASRTTS